MKEGRLLIVDDNKSILKALHFILDPVFEEVKSVGSPNQIPTLLDKGLFDVILLDMNFQTGVNTGNEGIYWMKRIFQKDPDAVIIPITAYGDIELAVKAIRDGAFDFVLKPWENQKLITTLKAGLKHRLSKKELRTLKKKQKLINEEISNNDIFQSTSSEMKDVYSKINKLAQTETNILIIGENGTGKELIAREIHKKSFRKNELMLTVDMATLNESLFESELFGHLKGAFTDAKENRTGKFEAASGGSLFLDEIGNLPVSLQPKLLSALQNRHITPIGSNKEIPIDVRLICATNKNLEKMIRENFFREDLYYRINTIILEIPPLRDRGDDKIKLAEFFLKKNSVKYRKPLIKFNSTAIDCINEYQWPGNVRELMHAVEKAVILSDSDNISSDDLGVRVRAINEKDILSLEDAEKNAIIKALQRSKGNVSSAANELKIIRQTLYRKMKKYDL
ncbi:sigma-54-dependent transcriptional regulator [Bacteroidota bacterium]